MGIINFDNIEIEDQLFINTIIDLAKKDKYIKEKIEKSLLNNSETIDTRNKAEKKRTE